MHRQFITLIVSAAIGVTALATPARAADADDVAGALFGIAALALIGKALSDRNKNDVQFVQPQHHSQPDPVRPIRPRPLPPAVSRYDLPGHCMRSFQVNRNRVQLLGAGCLRRYYRQVNSLPYACQFQFNNHNRSYTTYEPLCLRERGYRITRR
ncbi:MAG: hypothetical protein AB3N13_05865 [Arenibacterium sp.]